MIKKRIGVLPNSTFEEPTVNLTPLIDVVFVILIMFIVIAPLLQLDQVELAEGPLIGTTPTAQSVKESGPITVYVRHDNTIWFNDQSTTPLDLITQLRLAKQQFPQAHPQIFHDKRAHFGTYQSVKNAAESAGFSQIDIILKPA
jgi:biopolymer transport protein ExbD